MEQTYIIKNQESFELKDIFDCGQCFRWNKENDNSYTGIFKDNVLNVRKEIEKNESNIENNRIIFSGICNGNIEEIVREYFDLDRNYNKIKEKLSKIDNNMKTSIEYGQGIRILNQDLWEMIISFIISENNNIPRIKKIINNISKKYGNEIEYKDKTYYTFPSLEKLETASMEDLRALGLGFRDKYIYKTCKMINNKEIKIYNFDRQETRDIRNELLRLEGIGPKVADCILLFSDLKRLEVFPIDVWVRRVMNDLYIHNTDEKKVNKKEIEQLAVNKFGDLAGIAQQYLFYWKRNR